MPVDRQRHDPRLGGAQYVDGTTDITRTIAVGEPSPLMKDRYTRVLKGMIAISLARFPKGAAGSQLDSFARRFPEEHPRR